MKVNKVLSALLTQTWLIESQAAEGYMPVVFNLLDRETGAIKDEDQPKEKEPAQLHGWICLDASGTGASALQIMAASAFDGAPAGSIAFHRLEGPMMKDDYCGSPGTRTLGSIIKEADSHENISAHLMLSNSPGGTVAGTEDFSAIIKATEKPFVVFVENMHSAAYWAGSGADVIILGGQTASAGSIGTMTSITDFSGYYEKFGIKTHNVRATESVDKNEGYYQALAGKYEKIRSEVLDPLNEVFLSAVKANRGDKLDLKKENVLTGKVYHGKTAIAAGLADEIGSFDYAVQKAMELAGQSSSDSNKSTSNNNSETMFGKKFPKVAALAGKKAEEITAEEVTEANAELEAAGITGVGLITEAALDALETSASTADQMKKDKETLTSANTKLTSDLATAQAEVARLGALDGDKPTGSGKKDTEMSEEGGSETQKVIDNLEHNKALADNPLFN